MIVAGVSFSDSRVGLTVIERMPLGRIRVLHSMAYKLDRRLDEARRYFEVLFQISNVFRQHRPEVVAVERVSPPARTRQAAEHGALKALVLAAAVQAASKIEECLRAAAWSGIRKASSGRDIFEYTREALKITASVPPEVLNASVVALGKMSKVPRQKFEPGTPKIEREITEAWGMAK